MTDLEIKDKFIEGFNKGLHVNLFESKDPKVEGGVDKTMAIFNFLGKIPFVGTVSAAIKFAVGSIAFVVSTVA